MLFKKSWKYKTTGTDGNGKLFGVNIFDYEWRDTGETVTIIDPQYHQEHIFNVFTIEIDGKLKRFAAGEFSNCVWGFYVER